MTTWARVKIILICAAVSVLFGAGTGAVISVALRSPRCMCW